MPEVVRELESIWKMMPETDMTSSVSMEIGHAIMEKQSSSPSPGAFYHFMSSDVPSSDHVNAVPSVTPR